MSVQPGDTIAIAGAGPVGLAALLTARFYSPAAIFRIDPDDNRLHVAKTFGATALFNRADGTAIQQDRELTHGEGVDVALEAVGLPATFDICQSVIGAGGRFAHIGVHGKPVLPHLENLSDRNATLTTRLVDTVSTPILIKSVLSGALNPCQFMTHRFAMDDILRVRNCRCGSYRTPIRTRIPATP